MQESQWAGHEEVGYVKQKEPCGKKAQKLRGVIPNSTILRLLTEIVLSFVRPYAETYSSEHCLNARVLGASKGGQTLDIALTAQLALMCGRDDMDRAACGQMDIRNFHDSMSRTEMYNCQVRRGIPRIWSVAAIRLQICPAVKLCVRNTTTPVIPRSRGALTGNNLAPWFGRLMVEDAFLAAMPLIQSLGYSFMGISLQPMAWSDNIMAFGKSPSVVARTLAQISDILALKHLHIKEDSCEIVPASTRRLRWPSMRAGALSFDVKDEMKSLGFWISCNGDTTRNKSTMLGILRGKLALMDKRFSAVSQTVKAFWWKLHSRGAISYFAPFIGINRTTMRALEPIINAASRKLLNVRARFNVSSELSRVREQYDACIQSFFCGSIVRYVGHTFRHANHAVCQLLSLPLQGRLTQLRLQGRRRVPSETAQANRNLFVDLGIHISEAIAGSLDVRGHAGPVFRWGDGWFWELGDNGPGWRFAKDDKAAIACRINLLLNLFRRKRDDPILAIADALAPSFLQDVADEPRQSQNALQF